jgi:hypothetical protein
MGAQQRRVGQPAAGQQQALPQPALAALQGEQRRGKPLRVAGQAGGVEVGVVFAGPRQCELHQPADGGGEDQQQDGEPRHLHAGRQHRRQRQGKRHQAKRRHQAGEPGEDVAQRHDLQVAVADMAHLMGEDAGQLAQVEAAQQPVGDGNGRVLRAAHGKSVHHAARHVVQPGHGGQIGAHGELAHDAVQLGKVVGAQGSCPVEPEHQSGRDLAGRPQPDAGENRSPDDAGGAEQDPGDERHQAARAEDQQPGMQHIAEPVAPPFGFVEKGEAKGTMSP